MSSKKLDRKQNLCKSLWPFFKSRRNTRAINFLAKQGGKEYYGFFKCNKKLFLILTGNQIKIKAKFRGHIHKTFLRKFLKSS